MSYVDFMKIFKNISLSNLEERIIALSHVDFKKYYLIIYLAVIVAKSTLCTTTLHVVFIKIKCSYSCQFEECGPTGKGPICRWLWGR